MSKYDFQFKLKIVKENEAGLGRRHLSKKYDVSESTIRNWITLYKRHGEDGLKPKKPSPRYSGDFKFFVIQYRKEHGLSYNETAENFGLRSGSNVERWQREFNKNGVSGWYRPTKRSKKSGESNMKNKNQNSLKNASSSEKDELIQSLKEENVEIKEENMELKAEVLYLKKLEALILQKELQTEKKQE